MTPAITPEAPGAGRYGFHEASARSVMTAGSRISGIHASTSKAITLQTKEGDKVTLAFDHETVAVYGRDGRLTVTQFNARHADGAAIARRKVQYEENSWLAYQTRQEVTVTIEGDLSPEERRDIRRVIRQIDRRMRPLLSEGEPANISFGGKMRSDLDSLAAVDVNYRHAKTMMSMQASQITDNTYRVANDERRSARMHVGRFSGVFKTVIDEAIETIRASRVAPQHFIAPIRNLFAALSDEGNRREAPRRPMINTLERLILKRIRAIQTPPRGTD